LRLKQVSVIGDSDASLEACVFAEELGRRIAERGWALVSGGRDGVMEAASRGCREAGGLALGILPGPDDSGGNEYCQFQIPTNLGWARNSLNAMAGDAVVAIGGKAGTLTEIAFAWSYRKPILAVKGFGGWSERLAGQAIDDRREDRILSVASPDEAEALLVNILGED